MCTVTFIRTNDRIFLTSNRDEKYIRGQAQPPKIYRVGETTLLYPRDADAGGTWIALKDNSNAAVILNGAFRTHVSQPPYRRSRGLILLDILAAAGPHEYFSIINLNGIEPFTVILYEDGKLMECRWDGIKKYSKQLNTGQNHIWSSATLYDAPVLQKREDWFVQWMSRNKAPSQQEIFLFHQFGGDGDERNDIRMNRDGKLFTVSITGIELKKEYGIMHYLDLKDGAAYKQELKLTTALPV